MRCDRLHRGGLRLSDPDASFVVRRARAGIVLVRARGFDRGQFGTTLFAELSAELERFPGPLVLFVDALEVQGVAVEVRETWTAWIEQRRHDLQRVHMLIANRAMQLVADIASHQARAAFVTHSTEAGFWDTLRSAAGDRITDALRDDDPRSVSIREHRIGDTLTLSDGACEYVFRSPAPGVVVLRISGTDAGTLSSAAFDELTARRRANQPLQLFIDLREASLPGPEVPDLWSAWFAAHRASLDGATILSTRAPVSLVAEIASWRSRTGGLVRHLSDPQAYESALRRYGPRVR